MENKIIIPENLKNPTEEYKPVDIICVDCKARFTWTVGEQKYYKDRELAAPRRCDKCRLERRQQIKGTVNIMDGNIPNPLKK